MKIYVAGKYEEKRRVRQVQDKLKAAGHAIIHDWTREPKTWSRAAVALADRQAVMDAEAYVGVFEKDLPYKGAFTEMGIAIAKNIPIYILGNAADANIFLDLPWIKRGIEE